MCVEMMQCTNFPMSVLLIARLIVSTIYTVTGTFSPLLQQG